MRPDTTPKFCKPRSVPYALREQIEKELDRLFQQGVLEKVEYSAWGGTHCGSNEAQWKCANMW